MLLSSDGVRGSISEEMSRMAWGVRVLNRLLHERGYMDVYSWLGFTDNDEDMVWYWTHADCSRPQVLGKDYDEALRAAHLMKRCEPRLSRPPPTAMHPPQPTDPNKSKVPKGTMVRAGRRVDATTGEPLMGCTRCSGTGSIRGIGGIIYENPCLRCGGYGAHRR